MHTNLFIIRILKHQLMQNKYDKHSYPQYPQKFLNILILLIFMYCVINRGGKKLIK